MYCLDLFTYHLHRFIFKCPPYIQHNRIGLIITYTDLLSSVLRTSNIYLLSCTLHLSLTPIYIQVSPVHPAHLYCLDYHLRFKTNVLLTFNTSLLSQTLQLSLTLIYIQVFSVHPTHPYWLDYHLHLFIFKCPLYIQHIRIVLIITYDL